MLDVVAPKYSSLFWENGSGDGEKSCETSTAGLVAPKNGSNADDDDDWETDPDYVNDMSEEQQRWGGQRDGGGAIE
jgi:hypothetical protein